MKSWPMMLSVVWLASAVACGADPVQSARRIDTRLTDSFQKQDIKPAPQADDAEFLRRVSLDVIGRTPTTSEIARFEEDARPDKRRALIDELLANTRHAEHFAMTWRSLLLPEATSDRQVRYFQAGFEAWLRKLRQEDVGFDILVRDLLAVPITASTESPQLVLKDLKQPNPLAFIAAKNGDAGTVAASATRLFLGIRIECAQCHNHPFDRWTQQQFWNQAAFFAGLERRGKGVFAPLIDVPDRRTITRMNSDEVVPALFLDGSQPTFDAEHSTRTEWVDWVVSPKNDRFAQAITNRVWGQLLGVGIVDPVDDFQEGNRVSHPQLLQELAADFAESGFKPSFLYRAICQTEAYGRTSRRTHASQDAEQSFARMAIKPMSGEQLFDSLALAIGYESKSNRLGAGRDEDQVRRRVLDLFQSNGEYSDPQTSVTHALTLMNGRLVNDAASAETSPTIKRLLSETQQTTASRIESLYLITLSHRPDSDQQQPLVAYVEVGDEKEQARRLGDVFWALLNSAEFRWNH